MPLTSQDLFLAARARLLALTDRYTAAAIDKEGNDINILLRIMAGVGEELSLESSAQDLARALATVASTTDEQVERLCSDLTGGQVRRFGDASAIVDLQWSRQNTYALTLDAGTTASDLQGNVYRLVNPISWSSGQNTPKTVLAEAENTGRQGNVVGGSITKPSSNLGDTTLSVTNPTAASGGREQETIPELISRARDWFLNAARGTLSAIEYGAKQDPGVVQATATELLFEGNTTQLPFYRVTMTIADANGQAGTALANRARAKLQEYRCAGVPVLLVGGSVLYVPLRWQKLVYAKGYDPASVQAALVAKLLAVSLGPDIKLERSLLLAIAKLQVDGIAGVPNDALLSPAADVTPPAGYTIKFKADAILFL
ncbi:baseplate J/gp47 family protein [uncultured Zoogloea sp.]|jgi:hypothetical protein|uniref:baseplate J/gp47 family protein n=1 Tax=uncultured Zoogloea sp. TaxID=160237 RepID=UPI00262DFB80|nr:baseplate J/gp47 family protein [uncultured Zoogloea sp.]